MARSALSKVAPVADEMPRRRVEKFSVPSSWFRASPGLRLDAGFYNPRVADVVARLRNGDMAPVPLGTIVKNVFIPPRFKRIYVEKEHGVPFLQGRHVPQFELTDMQYLSRTAHERIDRWVIRSGWVLVTCSGSIGRVTVSPEAWDGWAASQHILRIVPEPESPCGAGYIYAFLMSEYGQAQLTSTIYGAVVDEITENHARSILIPKPTTKAQRDSVAEINRVALDAIRIKAEAYALAQKSVVGSCSLVEDVKLPMVASAEPAYPEPDDDAIDAEIARRQIEAIKKDPSHLVGGAELEKALEEIVR